MKQKSNCLAHKQHYSKLVNLPILTLYSKGLMMRKIELFNYHK
jgi:hypothetical protein